MAKNEGLKTMRIVNKALGGIQLTAEEAQFVSDYGPEDYAVLRYALITSCDVKRTLSRYLNVLRANRERITVEHL